MLRFEIALSARQKKHRRKTATLKKHRCRQKPTDALAQLFLTGKTCIPPRFERGKLKEMPYIS
jgi:hypothetical protein